MTIRTIKNQKTQLTLLVTGLLIFLFILLVIELSSNTIIGSKDYEVKYVSIKIQENDTLWNLSKEFINPELYTMDEYIDEIIQINGLISDKIYVGQRLTIPVINNPI